MELGENGYGTCGLYTEQNYPLTDGRSCAEGSSEKWSVKRGNDIYLEPDGVLILPNGKGLVTPFKFEIFGFNLTSTLQLAAMVCFSLCFVLVLIEAYFCMFPELDSDNETEENPRRQRRRQITPKRRRGIVRRTNLRHTRDRRSPSRTTLELHRITHTHLRVIDSSLRSPRSPPPALSRRARASRPSSPHTMTRLTVLMFAARARELVDASSIVLDLAPDAGVDADATVADARRPPGKVPTARVRGAHLPVRAQSVLRRSRARGLDRRARER